MTPNEHRMAAHMLHMDAYCQKGYMSSEEWLSRVQEDPGLLRMYNRLTLKEMKAIVYLIWRVEL